jgi:hypothetical protein
MTDIWTIRDTRPATDPQKTTIHKLCGLLANRHQAFARTLDRSEASDLIQLLIAAKEILLADFPLSSEVQSITTDLPEK